MITEVGRDALVEPPNYEALSMALSLVDEPVIAAGGVRDLNDIAELTDLKVEDKRVAGVVVGREVTAGRFTVEQCAAAGANAFVAGTSLYAADDMGAAISDLRAKASLALAI